MQISLFLSSNISFKTWRSPKDKDLMAIATALVNSNPRMSKIEKELETIQQGKGESIVNQVLSSLEMLTKDLKFSDSESFPALNSECFELAFDE